MKIIFRLKILLVLIGVYAARLCAQELSFGARAGLNLSSQQLSDDYQQSKRLSIPAGIYCDWVYSEKVHIQAELLYNPLGTKYNSVAGGRPETTLRFNYLSLPVSIKYYLSKQIHVFGGPQVGYLLTIGTNPLTNLKTDDYKSLDFGGLVGLGYELDRVNFGMRYYGGFVNVNRVFVNGSGSGLASIRNNAFQFLIGYRLWNIKRK